MKIKSLDEKDLVACINAHQNAFAEEPWCEEWSNKKSLKRLADIYFTPGFIGFTYMKENKIIGAVLGNIEEDHKGQYYFLKELFVHPDHQGLGIGSRLLNKIEEVVDEREVEGIILFTSRIHGTHQFYEKNCYQIGHGLVLMAKYMK